jgi:hypothetical protein
MLLLYSHSHQLHSNQAVYSTYLLLIKTQRLLLSALINSRENIDNIIHNIYFSAVSFNVLCFFVHDIVWHGMVFITILWTIFRFLYSFLFVGCYCALRRMHSSSSSSIKSSINSSTSSMSCPPIQCKVSK